MGEAIFTRASRIAASLLERLAGTVAKRGALIFVVGILGVLMGRQLSPDVGASFKRLTFRRGAVLSARFAHDMNSEEVLYTAAWDGKPPQVFSVRLGSPESRPLDQNAVLLAVSPSKVAVILTPTHRGSFLWEGTLADRPLAGGGPQERTDNVQYADWAPDGTYAVARSVGGAARLDFLPATYSTSSGWISHPRVSRDGESVAFLEHPRVNDDEGAVMLLARRDGSVLVARLRD